MNHETRLCSQCGITTVRRPAYICIGCFIANSAAQRATPSSNTQEIEP